MTGMIALYLLVGLIGLVLGGELLVRGASKLALSLGIPSVVVGLTVVAFGTSTPELAVSLSAAFEGSANIAVSNIVGSNIFNVLFILGLSAVIFPLVIHTQISRREVPIMIGVSLALFAASYNGLIGRAEGLLLFVGIIAYTFWLVRESLKERQKDKRLEKEANKFVEDHSLKTSILVSALLVAAGLGIVMFGADWFVKGAIHLAKNLGVSDTIVGLTIVAAGTSLPEVAASVMATIKGERDIAVANVVGSNIYNILCIVGLSASVVPGGLNVDPNMISIDMPFMIFVAALCWPLFKTGGRISRGEGALLLSLYVGYTIYLIFRAG
jgi:cation:H+ antiporter